MTTSAPRIAIIGGGLAGLVFLVTLHRRGIPATIYEREAGISARAHLGGMLDLGWEGGQRTLRENGLEEAFKTYARPEGDEFKITDKTGNALLSKSGEDVDKMDPRDVRPEIDRSALRKILFDAVPSESVKWGHGLSDVRPLGNGQHELTFSNGAIIVCDILVGADGAYSRVRPLVSSATPIYHGITGTEISLAPDVAARPEFADIIKAVGNGSVYSAQDEKNMIFQHNGDGRIRAYAWFRAPAEWTTPGDPAEARKVLLETFKDWAPWMRKVIENCDDAAIYHRPLYYLPVGHRWDHVPGVTLIGDAAHLMSPYAGAGANLAMLDGFELGLALADIFSAGKGVEEREAAVAAWEEKMFISSGKITAVCMANLTAFYSPGAPQTVMEKVSSFMEDPAARRDA
ncbi:monooxygenase [Daedaleopsis nitida]|nr:monooxygenase [Daedaleopsis nitida]